MRKYPRASLLALAALAAFALSGCFAATPVEPPAPTASATPVFASEEEALAAATEAYAAYLAVSDGITEFGGGEPLLIAPYVSEDYLEQEVNGFETLRSRGIFTRGQSSFDTISLQQYTERLTIDGSFTTYLCSDVSLIRLEDAGGADVTPAARPERIPLEIEFELSGLDPLTIVIGRSDVWQGENFC